MEASMTQKPRILTFGEPLAAMVPDGPGTLSQMHQLRPYPAGAELNTAVGLCRLGLDASYACCTGNDAFGMFLRTSAQAEGVDARFMQTSTSAPTAILFKQWTGLHKRTSVYYYRNTSPMAVGEWNPDAVRDGIASRAWDWVHATGITWMIGEQSAATSTVLFRLAHEQGIPVSFDINVRLKLAGAEAWRQLAYDVLPFVSWFFLGDEEAVLLFGVADASEIEQKFRDRGWSGIGVIVKQGDKGATASVSGQITSVPVWPVSAVVDTVGAGDGFNAGFIAGCLRGGDLEEAMRLGSLVGAFAVTSAGDYDGYPTWSEAEVELSEQRSVER